jgi:Domain of unknown function (DUF4407)
MMGKFLTALSGARSDVLKECETERLKFQSLGWAILITSVMATVSMWFALTSVMGLNPVGAFFVALVWGLIIMGIDRWLVTSMPSDGSRRWPIALPRLLLAVLLGTLISTPLVLRIFQSEINTQIAVIKQQQAAAFLTRQQNSSLDRQVTYWRNDVANLEQVISSGGYKPINPSTDPGIQSLTKQKSTELTLEQKYYQQWQCQLYGGAGCTRKGNGPLAHASQHSYQQAVAQVALLDNEIQGREKALSATDRASEHSRLEQAIVALPKAKAQLSSAMAQEDTLRSNFYAENNATNGLLIRLEALNQLSGNNFTLNAARLLLFLLFLVIECLPVTVKLLQQPGHYEKLLAERAELEFREARRAMRAQVPESAAPGSAAATPAARDLTMEQIWHPRTKMTDLPAWKTTAETEYIDRPDEPDEDSRLDTALRQMRDLRAPAETDGHRGGIELRYGDDDL